jgi:hypothetical protein
MPRTVATGPAARLRGLNAPPPQPFRAALEMVLGWARPFARALGSSGVVGPNWIVARRTSKSEGRPINGVGPSTDTLASCFRSRELIRLAAFVASASAHHRVSIGDAAQADAPDSRELPSQEVSHPRADTSSLGTIAVPLGLDRPLETPAHHLYRAPDESPDNCRALPYCFCCPPRVQRRSASASSHLGDGSPSGYRSSSRSELRDSHQRTSPSRHPTDAARHGRTRPSRPAAPDRPHVGRSELQRSEKDHQNRKPTTESA